MKKLLPDLIGRLANQLFQISATYMLAEKYGFEPVFPPRTLNPTIWPNYHLGFDLPFLREDIRIEFEVYEKDHNYIDLSHCTGNTHIQGYFQKYTYVYPVIWKMREIFKIPAYSLINWCGIHVRRGDFLEYPDEHNVLPGQYYKNAIKRMNELDPGGMQFLITSDDKPWCAEFFKDLIQSSQAIITDENNSPLEDFYQLCRCENIITGNSSFSQLAGMLNLNPDKIIISPPSDPKKWFGRKTTNNTVDLLPPEFIIVDYEN